MNILRVFCRGKKFDFLKYDVAAREIEFFFLNINLIHLEFVIL